MWCATAASSSSSRRSTGAVTQHLHISPTTVFARHLIDKRFLGGSAIHGLIPCFSVSAFLVCSSIGNDGRTDSTCLYPGLVIPPTGRSDETIRERLRLHLVLVSREYHLDDPTVIPSPLRTAALRTRTGEAKVALRGAHGLRLSDKFLIHHHRSGSEGDAPIQPHDPDQLGSALARRARAKNRRRRSHYFTRVASICSLFLTNSVGLRVAAFKIHLPRQILGSNCKTESLAAFSMTEAAWAISSATTA